MKVEIIQFFSFFKILGEVEILFILGTVIVRRRPTGRCGRSQSAVDPRGPDSEEQEIPEVEPEAGTDPIPDVAEPPPAVAV